MCSYMPVTDVYAREILDSWGNPTLEVELMTEDGSVGRAAVPSGISVGAHEAVELRDGEARYHGKGVLKVCHFVNTILADAVIGENVYDQAAIDRILCREDGTEKKKNLGANAILGVSMAAAVTAAKSLDVPLYRYLGGMRARRLPVPMMNVLSGGVHAASLTGDSYMDAFNRKTEQNRTKDVLSGVFSGRAEHDMAKAVSPDGFINDTFRCAESRGRLADTGRQWRRSAIDMQGFMIMPVGACGFEHGLQMCVEVTHTLKMLLSERIRAGRDDAKQAILPAFTDTETILSLLTEATRRAGYRPGEEIVFALDVAAGELYEKDSQTYLFSAESKKKGREIRRTRDEMISYLEELCSSFPIASIEDGLEENDWEGWKKLTGRLGGRVQILGDDLFATNRKRLEKGIQEGAANAIVIKANQVGTLTEAFQTIELAQRNGYQIVVSHRFGETEDTLIADLAVAAGAGQIKAGAPCHSERVAKYNQLLRIEDALGLSASYFYSSNRK